MRAIGGAAEINLWVQHPVPAVPAGLLAIILEELHGLTAFRAVALKYILAAPITAILSWTLHLRLLLFMYTQRWNDLSFFTPYAHR
jgi:hypothetical protein